MLTTSQCTVIDKIFTTIGLARVPVTSKALTGVSWTEGVAVTDGNNNRTYLKNFYFGTPPALDLSGTGACALFFGEVSTRVAFPGVNPRESQGTCRVAMTSSCADALIKRAMAVDVTGLESVEACTKLETAFRQNLDSECASFARGSSWAGMSVQGNL